MENKILTKRECVFIYIALAVINILCIVKFMWSFIDILNFIDYLEMYEEILWLTEFKQIKVVQIISLCLAIIMLLMTAIFFFLKKASFTSFKRNILIVLFSILLLIGVFFFVNRFFAGNLMSDNYIKEIEKAYKTYKYFDSISPTINETANINMIYLVASGILSILMSFSVFNVMQNNEADAEEEKDEINEDEKLLQEEIQKLKNKVRIKNLEDEYLKLKSQLDKK